VGHSTGGGEVARYIGRHGTKRVAKAVLIAAVPPIMVKSAANPGGLPEDHVVSRRGLAGARGIRHGWAVGRPVVPSEHERGEIDLLRELKEPIQCRGPRIE
jgi:pimeloyl-ACP methyl ester carboxylesterase